MKHKMVSWNVRGLNDRAKRLRIRDFLRDWNAYIICLQDNKLESICRDVMHSLWGFQHVD
jgi:exonuclease III